MMYRHAHGNSNHTRVHLHLWVRHGCLSGSFLRRSPLLSLSPLLLGEFLLALLLDFDWNHAVYVFASGPGLSVSSVLASVVVFAALHAAAVVLVADAKRDAAGAPYTQEQNPDDHLCGLG